MKINRNDVFAYISRAEGAYAQLNAIVGVLTDKNMGYDGDRVKAIRAILGVEKEEEK